MTDPDRLVRRLAAVVRSELASSVVPGRPDLAATAARLASVRVPDVRCVTRPTPVGEETVED